MTGLQLEQPQAIPGEAVYPTTEQDVCQLELEDEDDTTQQTTCCLERSAGRKSEAHELHPSHHRPPNKRKPLQQLTRPRFSVVYFDEVK